VNIILNTRINEIKLSDLYRETDPVVDAVKTEHALLSYQQNVERNPDVKMYIVNA
jgi:hypothetical protein